MSTAQLERVPGVTAPSGVRRAPFVVVGGGPAGSAAAISLARAGLAPLLLERDPEPRDALCGGFLSWETIRRLRALGVDPFELGAHHVARLAIFSGGRSAEAALPAPAAGLSRRALDSALLAQAIIAGAGVERGVGVRTFRDGQLLLDDSATVTPGRMILATGKHELRGCPRPRVHGDSALGLRWRLRLDPALAQLLDGRIELHLFRGGYAGLVRHEANTATLCLAVRQSRFGEAQGRPQALLDAIATECPALGIRLDRAAEIDPPQAVANIPYGWRADSRDGGPYRVGDQAAVIPSLAGEGIAIALASGVAAAHAAQDEIDASRYQAALRQRLSIPFALAGGIWRLAEHRWGAAAIVGAVRAAPGLATGMSHWTRINEA